MAGNNGSEIRVAGTGKILVAKAGTAIPADTAAPWSAEWADLGYTTTDGIKFNKKDKIDPVDTWQSVSPARFIYSDRDLTVKFQLLQLNKDTLPFFMGGDAVTAVGTPANGQFKYELASNPKKDERALAIEFSDGGEATYRFIMQRGQVTETEEMALTRTGAVKLGVTFTALAVDDTKPLATILMKDKAYGAPAA
ncbi:phage tail protein [Streptomyces sp. NPDC017056]|uniref:phage tail tube protein n=1 Tax=Streptomyces sp. NPDC017056 TaxID=3364973 RepID=UPI00379D85BC